MNCKKAKKLLVYYVEESLADGRRKAVENHLSQCERCRAELSEIQKLKENLLSLDAPEPGADFWRDFDGRLAQELATEEASAPTRGFAAGPLSWQPRLAFVAAARRACPGSVVAGRAEGTDQPIGGHARQQLTALDGLLELRDEIAHPRIGP